MARVGILALQGGFAAHARAVAALGEVPVEVRSARDLSAADALVLPGGESTVMLDHDGSAKGYAMLRRFGRGHVIGPVAAPDAESARALISHLAGLNAGRYTRVDVDAAIGLSPWLESIGLPRVDVATTMVRGTLPAPPPGAVRTVSPATQAMG